MYSASGRYRRRHRRPLEYDGLVLHDGRAQRDAGIHRSVGRDVPDSARIDAAPRDFQLVDDLHGTDFRRARYGPGRKSGEQRIDSVEPFPDLTFDMRGDVHDVAVVLDDELILDRNRADLRHPADVISSKVEQHEVLCPFLRIREKIFGECLVLIRIGPAPPRSGKRPNGHDAVAEPDQNLGAGADDRVLPPEIEKEQERRWVQTAQRAIERERPELNGTENRCEGTT